MLKSEYIFNRYKYILILEGVKTQSYYKFR